MNANAIFSGEEYAYAPYRTKGKFPTNCKQVVALASRKTREYGNSRYSTEVQIEYDDGRTTWVRARDIYSDWDTYTTELEEYNERQRIAQAELAEAEAIRKAKLEEQYLAAAKLLQVPREVLHGFTYNRNFVMVDLPKLEEYRKEQYSGR